MVEFKKYFDFLMAGILGKKIFEDSSKIYSKVFLKTFRLKRTNLVF